MLCTDWRKLWEDSNNESAAQWRAHLVTCAGCRSWQAETRLIEDALRAIPHRRPARGFEGRVWRRLDTTRGAEGVRVLIPEALVAVLVVAGAVFVLLMPGSSWAAALNLGWSALVDLAVTWRDRSLVAVSVGESDFLRAMSVSTLLRWLLVMLVIAAWAMHHGLNRLVRPPGRAPGKVSWS
jgi:hypothetical protein